MLGRPLPLGGSTNDGVCCVANLLDSLLDSSFKSSETSDSSYPDSSLDSSTSDYDDELSDTRAFFAPAYGLSRRVRYLLDFGLPLGLPRLFSMAASSFFLSAASAFFCCEAILA